MKTKGLMRNILEAIYDDSKVILVIREIFVANILAIICCGYNGTILLFPL